MIVAHYEQAGTGVERREDPSQFADYKFAKAILELLPVVEWAFTSAIPAFRDLQYHGHGDHQGPCNDIANRALEAFPKFDSPRTDPSPT